MKMIKTGDLVEFKFDIPSRYVKEGQLAIVINKEPKRTGREDIAWVRLSSSDEFSIGTIALKKVSCEK